MLGVDGRVFRAACASERTSCSGWWVEQPASARIQDIASLPAGQFLAVGEDGLIQRWVNDRWRLETPPPGSVQDTLMRIVIGPDARPVVFGRRSEVVFGEDGQWQPLSPELAVRNELATFEDATALPNGTYAAVARSPVVGDYLYVLEDGVARQAYTGARQRLAVHGLPDGRLVVAVAHADDPAVGGWLEIWAPPYRERQGELVTLPRTVDPYGLADDGEFLFVAGSGWTAMKIPLDSLPGARTRATPTPR